VKKAALGRLLAIPGVHAVGIGSKIVGGKPTDEPSIMVFVVKKKPASELPPDHVIPAEIEGVKTDVFESDVFHNADGDEDDDKYRNPALIAGCRLFMGGCTGKVTIRHPPDPDVVFPRKGLGGIGTLGCFATTGGASPKAVAITCWHVLASPDSAQTTGLAVSPVAGGFSIGGTNTPGTLIVIYIGVSTGDYVVYYPTILGDTPTTIATTLAGRINALATAGLKAKPSGTQVTITLPGTGTLSFDAYGPHAENTWSDIHASVSGTTISLTGQASDPCAAFVVLNVGGAKPSYGIFVPIAAGSNASTVATAITTAITARKAELLNQNPSITDLSGVTAIEMDPPNPGDPATVGISGVQEVECDVSSDLRVGQPTNTFCSKCSRCCDDRIGTLLDAHLDVDAAVIQLDPTYVAKYRAEVLDIGAIRGVHDIRTEKTGYPLQKRGQTTRLTHGTLLATDMDGDISDDDPNTPSTWKLYGRHFTGAFTIQGKGGQFGDHGDSGSAILTDNAPNSNQELVGIFFGRSTTASIATPIQQILSAFPKLNLSIATATTTGVDIPVPAVAAALRDSQSAGAGDRVSPEPILEKLNKVEREITAIPAGRRYSELIQRHFPEAQRLVNTNRRVAVAWRRHGGPQIVRGVVRLTESPEEGLPAEINGKALTECLAKIQATFERYASPDLAADLTRYAPNLGQLAGLNYTQALDALRSMRMD
jgi:hypothetical protein